MAPPPELMEELVEEVLLRFPPEYPASLVRAALVCKLWCRLVCGAAFCRRFREFHFHRGVAPLLGVLYHDSFEVWLVRIPKIAYFVPTTSFRPAHAEGWGAIDARHGRVLLYCSGPSPYPHGRAFSVWDPVTDEQRDLPEPPPFYMDSWTTAAVACAATASGNCCDHLDCRRGPFVVVVMDIEYDRMMHLSVYSSEDGAWSKLTVCEGPNTNSRRMFSNMPGTVLVRSALYFLVHLNHKIMNQEIVKYDLATRHVPTIHLPSKLRQLRRSIVLMTDDDGGLGFVSCSLKYKLKLWSRVAGPDGNVDFVVSRVIDLQKVLPSSALIRNSPQVYGFVGAGASRVLFIRTSNGLYNIEINSNQVKKVANYCGNGNVIPYISFCTPNSRVQEHEYNFACLRFFYALI